MKKYYVYPLRCADRTYYTGVTNDPDRRLAEHLEGEDVNAYTYPRRPVELVWYDAFQSPMAAIEVEKQVKNWSRKKKEALIAGKFDLLRELATCLNKSHFSLKEVRMKRKDEGD
ncbi:GIY-YIG nuclease family protein [Fibrella aquatilis]|uniref:GIY-YIG nuclease family protein n=1 Tax=Fibrella aquatilis TaxID=2817059 RepID=A0A939G5P2_9BACT|nr:GIY-YIG nuclease family protein [Fibrella aquatilis]MBO0931505.1 GIY-YIG nuclease family protein [Fibrella aquatilis]